MHLDCKLEVSLAIVKNLLIDQKVENTFDFSIDCLFVSQSKFSNWIKAYYIIFLKNDDQKTVIDSTWIEIVHDK